MLSLSPSLFSSSCLCPILLPTILCFHNSNSFKLNHKICNFSLPSKTTHISVFWCPYWFVNVFQLLQITVTTRFTLAFSDLPSLWSHLVSFRQWCHFSWEDRLQKPWLKTTVYQFLCTKTLEEYIYQTQLSPVDSHRTYELLGRESYNVHCKHPLKFTEPLCVSTLSTYCSCAHTGFQHTWLRYVLMSSPSYVVHCCLL